MLAHRILLPLSAALLVTCAEDGELVLPDVIVSSEYVDYGTWAETSDVCMEERLALWDGFIERASEFLEVSPPGERVRYTWVPESSSTPERWGCRETSLGCHLRDESEHLVFVRDVETLHELVHAVEASALERAHRVFREGMAEYLSTRLSTSPVLSGFADEFVGILDAGPEISTSDEYLVAMHFVGSVVRRHGLAAYRELRRSVPPDGGVDEFASAYERLFGDDFLEALRAMEAQPVDGLWAPWGCQAAPGLEQLSWVEPGALQASLAGKCGDAYFYGGGDDGSKLLFFKEFGLQIEQDGVYRVLVDQGGGNAEPLFVRIESCPGTEFASLLVEGGTSGSMPFYAGQHFVRVYYPRDLDLVGEPRLEIEFVGPY